MSISPQNANDLWTFVELAKKNPPVTFVVILMILAVLVVFIFCRELIVEYARSWISGSKRDSSIPSNEKASDTVNILVIDDQHKSFSLRKILDDKDRYPWINYHSISDLESTTQKALVDADLVFVDINDVGKRLTPVTQGLGLAEEILNRYPKKVVVIYSSDIKQDMTHPVINRVAGRLYKEDEPRNFIKYAESIRNRKRKNA